MREYIKDAQISVNLQANVFCIGINGTRNLGYYDDSVKLYDQMFILPGSLLPLDSNDTGWGYETLKHLERLNCLKNHGTYFEVLTPIVGSPSGTASVIVGGNPGTAYGIKGKWRELGTSNGITKAI